MCVACFVVVMDIVRCVLFLMNHFYCNLQFFQIRIKHSFKCSQLTSRYGSQFDHNNLQTASVVVMCIKKMIQCIKILKTTSMSLVVLKLKARE